MAAGNERRHRRAYDALKDYERREDPLNAVADLLTDLRHFCHIEGHDFKAALARSQMHFEAEASEDDVASTPPSGAPFGYLGTVLDHIVSALDRLSRGDYAHAREDIGAVQRVRALWQESRAP